ncbi:MAG: 50S ribosomal protein L6 [Spirochaetaceae bacterium]|jgi:large subunit ribosomal protein L6|nr:50S ribosomal protein L6 [Spirochaetaceae bacterium]
MSRIGNIPVKVPQGVKVSFDDLVMHVEGPKGKLSQGYHGVISFTQEADAILVGRANEEKQTKSYHGLYRNLLNNMVVGVSTGWTKNLLITGVGYRAEVQGNILVLSLGFSSDIYMGIPDDIKVAVEANTKITVTGIDKQRVGEFSAQVRKLRPPEPYKGKGIRYEDEHIRRKVGKSGVK